MQEDNICTFDFSEESIKQFEDGWGYGNSPCSEFGDCESCPYNINYSEE